MTDKKKSDVTRATVKVVAIDSDRVWEHAGKAMKPGDTAEVTLDQATRLEKDGLATLVK